VHDQPVTPCTFKRPPERGRDLSSHTPRQSTLLAAEKGASTTLSCLIIHQSRRPETSSPSLSPLHSSVTEHSHIRSRRRTNRCQLRGCVVRDCRAGGRCRRRPCIRAARSCQALVVPLRRLGHSNRLDAQWLSAGQRIGTAGELIGDGRGEGNHSGGRRGKRHCCLASRRRRLRRRCLRCAPFRESTRPFCVRAARAARNRRNHR